MHFQLLVVILLAFSTITKAYNILVLVPFPGTNHWYFINYFVEELLNRGHHVTAVTNFYAKEKHPNYTEIVIDPPYDIPENFPSQEFFHGKLSQDISNLFMYWKLGLETSDYALETTGVEHLISRDDLDFDLIISEQFFQESFLMFAHKYHAPILTIGVLGYSDYMDWNMGLLTPWSFISHPILSYQDDMSFSERSYNFLYSLIDVIFRRIYYLPEQDKLANKFFASIDDTLPSVTEIERSVSVMLVNSHPIVSPIRPTISGLVNVAGAHIRPPQPLPDDIKEFLDGATEGAIYFSFGSYVQCDQMPKDRIKAFIEVFRNIKQRILWKYEDDYLHDIPENVMVRKWLPQRDILAHENVVLFITHGGMFGKQESIYHGIPMLIIPFYGDQYKNGIRCEKAGYAITLKFPDVNVITLGAAINELLTNVIYKDKAKRASDVFRDNPIEPMDHAMYWIEYVIRHKGAKHLKSASSNLSWYQYLMLDVVFFLISMVLLSTAIIYLLFKIFIDLSTPEKEKSTSGISTERIMHLPKKTKNN